MFSKNDSVSAGRGGDVPVGDRVLWRRVGWLLALGLALAVWPCLAAPFERVLTFTQPDGHVVQIWGQGDEFQAVFEAPDGYTVVFDDDQQAYCYAVRSPDGSELSSSGMWVGMGDPLQLGLEPHQRLDAQVARREAQERYAKWDAATHNSARWQARKAARPQAAGGTAATAGVSGPQLAPPPSTTIGIKVGLCIMVDFSDATGANTGIVPADVDAFCNGNNYTANGNNGSVKQFYLDNSNGRLIYTNVVVSVWVRVPYPKNYVTPSPTYTYPYFYNENGIRDSTLNPQTRKVDCAVEGNRLVNDAIVAMKALPNYATTILPLLGSLTVDGSSQVVATNVYFAGADSGKWQYGLWPNSYALQETDPVTNTHYGPIDLGNGKKVYNYQITNTGSVATGSALTIGTFCHENGHMLCDFPDLYDYQGDSKGGAGNFCLMAAGELFEDNPVQVCAYLKAAAGWANLTDLTTSGTTGTLSASGAGFNTFYQYKKPGVNTEYYLLENRQQAGRDANIPASGIAIWHIDELGDRDNQSLAYNSSHLNYECTLVQADNLWHFENNVNNGDSNDLYFAGNSATAYTNAFTDSRAPSARWWDGSISNLKLSAFSVAGTTMSFSSSSLGVLAITPAEGVNSGVVAISAITGFGFQAGAVVKLILAGQPDLPAVAGTTVVDSATQIHCSFDLTGAAVGYWHVVVTNPDASVGTGIGLFRVRSSASLTLLSEGFEAAFVSGAPPGWSKSFKTGILDWQPYVGDNRFGTIAHSGASNAVLYVENYTHPATYLISPVINLGGYTNATLDFWHMQAYFNPDQDTLSVYYRTGPANDWTLLTSYTADASVWTERVVTLPNTDLTSTYQIAFLGNANYGYGVCIDDVIVAADDPPPVIAQGSNAAAIMDEDGVPTPWVPPVVTATDASNDLLTWSLVSGPSHGSAVVNGTGATPAVFSYAPNADWSGGDSFVVQVRASSGGTDTITVNVTVNPRNDPPANTVLPSVSGVFTAGQLLTATPGTWNDGRDTAVSGSSSLAYAYQWWRADSAAGATAVAIVGATASAYTLTGTDGGKYVGVAVIATDNGVGLPAAQSVTQSSAWTLIRMVPVITWATPAAITYGTVLSATQLNAGTEVAGTFVYTPAAGTVLGAGNRTLHVDFTPADTGFYSSAAAEVSLTVNQATPVVSWATPVAIVYGTPLGGGQLNAAASIPGSYVYTPAAGAVLAVGNRALHVVFTPTDTTNYRSGTTADVTLTVNRAPLTITADSQRRVINTANPPLTASYSGLVNGDSAGSLDTPVQLSSTAVVDSPFGIYVIEATGATAANYAITLVNGTLAVEAAVTLTAGWNLISLPYGTDGASPEALFGIYPVRWEQVWRWANVGGSGYYVMAATLEAATGYWLYAWQDVTCVVPAATYEGGAWQVPLQPGWNLVGTLTEIMVPETVRIQPGRAGDVTIITFCYRLDAATGALTLLLPGDTLVPGEGYWVYSSDPTGQGL